VSDWAAPLNPNVEHLESSRIAEVWQLGFGRENLIPLWVGEGDVPTPAFICEAATRAMAEGKTFYTHKRGTPELRQTVADYTEGLYGVDLDVERVTITSSGMNGIVIVLQAIVAPGDNVVVVTPVWPNIMAAVAVVGGQVRAVGLDSLPEGGFRLDLDRLADAVDARTRAIFIASPGNPTGWVMEPDEQRAVMDLCRARGVWMIADEVYARFIYNAPAANRATAPSFLEVSRPDDPLVVVNSFSKTWAMTGWRMGWLTAPTVFAETLDKLIEFNTSGAPNFLQDACIAAIRDGEPFVQEQIERCRRGGELVFDRLSAIPRVRVARPRGSFYTFFALDGLDDSLAFAKRLLEETDVGLAPGSAFGPGGEGHLRLCFASSTERLSEALDRIEPVLAKG
jgi:aspartate/methionine/tyrosine aminotransferase